MACKKKTELQCKLFEMQDIKYRDFQRALIPNVEPERVIGVRTPMLRKFTKEWMKEKPEEVSKFLKSLPHVYYEENNIHGTIIAECKDYGKCIALLEDFLPHVDNWATCDMMRPKVFAKHLTELEKQVEKWLTSNQTYTVRFAIEMLMNYYLEEAFDEKYLEWVAAVQSEEYYVKMMVAWYFATALAKQYEKTITYIETGRLETWVHNKTIQKAVESYRITEEQKQYLRGCKKK